MKQRKATSIILVVLIVVNIFFDSNLYYAGTNWTINTSTLSVGANLVNNTIYIISEDKTITSGSGKNGLNVASNATVMIHIKEGVTLTVSGGSASGTTGGGAGIYVPKSATLIITGEGKLIANGGNAASGSSGYSGGTGGFSKGNTDYYWAGTGGSGGAGGGGAGAGIGTNGGSGGSSTSTTSGSVTSNSKVAPDGNARYDSRESGITGATGNAGSASSEMGKIYLLGKITVTANGGRENTSRASGGNAGTTKNDGSTWTNDWTMGAGGGGGAGGSGYGGANIGSGGSGAGSGGAGGTGGCYYDDTKAEYNYYLNGGGGSGGNGAVTGSNGGGSRTGASKTGHYGGYGGSGGGVNQSGSGGTLYIASTATLTTTTNQHSTTTYHGKGASKTELTEQNASVIPDSMKYSLNFNGIDTPLNYYFAMGSEITVPEYTETKPGQSFWGWKVTKGVSHLPSITQIASAYDFPMIRSTSRLSSGKTVYYAGDTITMDETAYGDMTFEPLIHEWKCEPDKKNADILNIYCTSESDEESGCQYHKNSGSPIVLKLSAEDIEYNNGQAYDKANIVNWEKIEKVVKNGISINWQYGKIMVDETRTLGSAPTDPGSYLVTAVVTCGENEYQLEKPFVISYQATIEYWQGWSSNSLYTNKDYPIQALDLNSDLWAMHSVSREAQETRMRTTTPNTQETVTQANLKNVTKQTTLKINLMDEASMEGVEVKVYQLLSITDGTDGTYSYTLADNAYSGFFKEYFGVDVIDNAKIMELLGTLDTNEAKKQFSNSLKDYIDKNQIKPLVSSVGGYGQKEMDFDISRQYSYENNEGRYFAGLGYYFITRNDAIDDTYTLRVINEPETTLTLKGSTLRIHKSGDQVLMKKGDSVFYTLESKIVNTGGNAEYWYCIYDWLEETMQADMDSFELYVQNGNSKIPLTKNRDYELSQITMTPEGTTSQNVIKIQLLFDQKSVLYGDSHMGDTLVVRYKARMKKTATSGIALGNENFNKAWLQYGYGEDKDKNVTETQEWNVYTLGLRIHKTDESENPLEGAEFKLYATNDVLRINPLRFSKDVEGYYYLDNEKGSSSLETDEYGNIDIHGLDETNFILRETKPPAGYQKIDDQTVQIMIQENEISDRFLSLDVEITKDRLVEVTSDINEGYITLNIKNPTQGSNDLPATGGRGRSIVYITASAMLVIGVGGLILKRKRENCE